MDDASIVNVCNSIKDGSDETCSTPVVEGGWGVRRAETHTKYALLGVFSLVVDTIIQFATSAKIEAEVETVGSLKASEQPKIA